MPHVRGTRTGPPLRAPACGRYQRRTTGPRAPGRGVLLCVRIKCRNNPRWALVGRTEYDAIVVLDVDVDLFLYTGGAPPAAGTLQADIVRFGEHIA